MQHINEDQPPAVRVAEFTGQRARILEQMTPTWRAARIHEPFSPKLARNKARTLTIARADLEPVLALELAEVGATRRQRLVDGLHAVSMRSFWESAADRALPRPCGGRGPRARHFRRGAGRSRNTGYSTAG